MRTYEIPDPLPLRNIDVPPEVSHVDGCDCGGLEWHRDTCTIWGVAHTDAMAAVEAAQERQMEFTAALNAKLAAARYASQTASPQNAP